MNNLLPLALLIAAGCGLISAVIAGSKGRSTGGYFLLGACLGIIGVIIAACARPAPVAAAPGWYPAPDGMQRYWDGLTWH